MNENQHPRGSTAIAAAARESIDLSKSNEQPPKRECCGTCRFWKPGNRMDRPGEEVGPRFDMHSDDIGHGMCRRKPPVFVPALAELAIGKLGFGQQYDKEEIFSEIDAEHASMFPGTWKAEWCGDFDWRDHLRPMDI